MPFPDSKSTAWEFFTDDSVSAWRATLNYQLVTNPAYNRDRGPASIFGARLRAQF